MRRASASQPPEDPARLGVPVFESTGMSAIDWILNCAGVLLWINWNSSVGRFPQGSPPLTLASTIKSAETRRGTQWLSLLALIVILAGRSFFYWHVGQSAGWTPSLDLGVIRLPFRSDYFSRMALFSLLSFACALAIFYAWLLLLSLLNGAVPKEEPMQRLLRLQLGKIEHLPASIKLLLPLLLSTLAWGLGSPGLVRMGIVPPPLSAGHLWQQALLLGASSYLVWKFALLVLCLLYLVNSYIYLGKSYFWQCVDVTGSNLLHPLRRLPVCFGKLDLSPILGIGLVLLLAHWAAIGLPRLFERLPF
jgi:uncharacterized protein YggT (Ycf19 family)